MKQKLYLFGYNHKRYILDLKNGKAIEEKNPMPNIKHGYSSIMFQGCMRVKGTETIRMEELIQLIIISQLMKHISLYVPQSVKMLKPKSDQIFQQPEVTSNQPYTIYRTEKKYFGMASHIPYLYMIENL